MNFTPKPVNDFAEYIRLYFDECRRRAPQIEAIAGKWTFEDLIPGLSDFDTRFIARDGMTSEDWIEMSTAVGEAHLDICRRYPRWDRNLEHLPGVNLTWAELTDPEAYYPECAQWTFYETTAPDRLDAAKARIEGRPWDARDEFFHLKKFCLYFGRYDRSIDPAVNIGPWESKYPLHSRFMHYFCPPMQSALCILLRRPIRGKMEALRIACERFGGVYEEMLDAVDRHYEAPELYEEPALTRLEDRLEAALHDLRDRLAPELALIPDAPNLPVTEWKRRLDDAPIDPYLRVFDAMKFSRLMKGRLRFYANAPDHFATTWLIENELRRLRRNFFEIPFGMYWELRDGRKPDDLAASLPALTPDVLDEDQARCATEFLRLLPGAWEDGRQREIAVALAGIFDDFFRGLSRIVDEVRRMTREKA